MKRLVDKKKKPIARQGRARKGEGSLRLKNGIYYYRIADPENPGKQVEGSCHTGDYAEAMKAKTAAIFRLHKDETTPVPEPTVKTGPTVADLLSEYGERLEQSAVYKKNADPDYEPHRALSGSRNAIKRLTAKLGHILAEDLTTADTVQYRKAREGKDGVIFSTVNQEFRYLRAAIRHAIKCERSGVTRVPNMWIPSEKSQVREGFMERDDDYGNLFSLLPNSLKALFVFGFHTGARDGELKKVRWDMVNFEKQLITIRAKTAKTGEGRYLPIWGDMMDALLWQKEIHDRECRKSPWVFFWHMDGGGAPGARLTGTTRQWKQAVTAIGRPTLLFHDLRRSAIKYCTQEADVESEIVRLMSGHKTDSVFQRYNIKGTREILKLKTRLNTHLGTSGGPRLGVHLVDPPVLKTA